MAALGAGGAAAVFAIAGRTAGIETVCGIAGPLAAACGSWVLTERTYRTHPEQLTGLLIGAFGAKAVFFGAYIAVMLKGLALRPVPFVASFTSSFIALYLIEALYMRRLFMAK